MDKNIEAVITEVFKLYELHGGDDYIGEPVSQLEHMVQAGDLAFQEGYDDEVVLAAFFHDIGHLIDEDQSLASMDGYGVVDHESVGAQYLLDRGFSERIAVCESHLDFSIRWKGNHGGIVEMRRHYSNYFRGMDHFKPFRTQLVTSYSLDEIKNTLQEIALHYAGE